LDLSIRIYGGQEILKASAKIGFDEVELNLDEESLNFSRRREKP